MALPIAAAAFWMGIVVPMAVSVLAALGIGFVTYTGADFAIQEAQGYVNANFSAMPSDMLAILTLAGVDQGVSIMFAGYAAAVTVKVTTGAFTRMKLTRPT